MKKKIFIIVITVIIMLVAIFAIFFSKKNNSENITDDNTILENEIEIENVNEENIIEENTTQENTIEESNSVDQENTIPSKPEEIQTYNTATAIQETSSIYEADSDVGTTDRKEEAINLVKEKWGEDSTVNFMCDQVTSNGEYIIAVVSLETASVRNYFRVNLDVINTFMRWPG